MGSSVLSDNARQRAIELEYGKSWPEVVDDLVKRHRSWKKVAQRLDIDRGTLWRWRRALEHAQVDVPAEVA